MFDYRSISLAFLASLVLFMLGLLAFSMATTAHADRPFGADHPPMAQPDCGGAYRSADPCHYGWAPDGSPLFELQQLLAGVQQSLGVRELGDIALGS